MKRMKALLLCAVAAAGMMFLLAGCTSQSTYTPEGKAASLSTPTIGKADTLRVGVNTSNSPLAALPSGSTKIVGIDVDMAAAIADSLGLKVEIVDVGSDPESALSAGKVDIVLGIDKTDTTTSFWTSDVYLPTAVALFGTSSSDKVPTASQVGTFTVAAQVSSKAAWAVTNEFGTDTLDPTNDLKSAIAELDGGQANYFAADAVIGSYAAHSVNSKAAIIALMQSPSGYCVGVADSNSTLKQAISQVVSSITTDGTVSVIEKKWLGTSLDFKSMPLTAGATTATSTSSTTKTS